MRVLMVIPKFMPPGYAYDFPLGLAYISSALKQAGHEVRCVNANHLSETIEETVTAEVRRFDPHVVASGGISPLIGFIRPVFQAARAAKPGVITLGGGGVVSAIAETAPKVLDLDYGVVGEGEVTAVELLRVLEAGEDPGTVDGLTFAGPDGTVVQTPGRKPIKDLDALAWPDYEGFDFGTLLESQNVADQATYNTHDDPRVLPMISSRSCPFACTFCFHPIGRIYRARSIDALITEIEHQVDRWGINVVDLCDELFAVKRDRVLEFCRRIQPMKLKWGAQLHVTLADPEVLEAMREAGCVLISYGLESVNETILESMCKKATRAQIDRALKLTYKARIGIQGNFIFGDAAETMETATDTLDWWAHNRRYRVNLSILQLYPGSPVYKKMEAAGRLPAPKDGLPPQGNFNATALPDAEHSHLLERISVLRNALVRPVRRFEVEYLDHHHPARGAYFNVSWECPRCSHENHFKNAVGGQLHNRQGFTFSCRACRGRFDVPNTTWRPKADAAAEEALEKALELRGQGRTGEAVRGLMALASTGNWAAEPADAVIRALRELGAMAMASPAKRAEAYDYLAMAVRWRPFDGPLHAQCALAAIYEGTLSTAELHLECAEKLAAWGATQEITRFIAEVGTLLAQRRAGHIGAAFFHPPAPLAAE